MGIKYNRHFIKGRECELISDNLPLCHLLRQQHPTGKVARWLTILSEYNITNIKHLKGIHNTIPDILSRLQDDNIETELLADLPFSCNNIKEVSGDASVKEHDNSVQAATPHRTTGNTVQWNTKELRDAQHRYKPYKDVFEFYSGK